MSKLSKAKSIIQKEGVIPFISRAKQHIDRRILTNTGLRGLLKTIYFSRKFTSSSSSIVFHSNTLTEISKNSTFEIGGRVLIGLSRGSNYSRAYKSHFRTKPGSSFTHSGESSANIGPDSKLSIGGDFSMGDSFLTSGAYIACNDEIQIGDKVAIGPQVTMMDSDFHELRVDGIPSNSSSPIHIKDDVWIGIDVSIKKGVTVGRGSVIGSHSVVTSDIPAGVLAVGCPATVVKENITWE